MIIEEFKMFNQILSNLEKLEKWHSENIQNRILTEAEIVKVNSSPQESYGFFKKNSKEDKLKELRKNEEIFIINIGVGNEILGMVYKVILEKEIPALKEIKKLRFEKIIRDFSQSRVQQLEKELDLWKTVSLYEELREGQERNQETNKIDSHDFRFTTLPKVKE